MERSATKLQRNKPLSGELRREQVERLQGEVGAWLEQVQAETGELVQRARRRALAAITAR